MRATLYRSAPSATSPRVAVVKPPPTFCRRLTRTRSQGKVRVHFPTRSRMAPLSERKIRSVQWIGLRRAGERYEWLLGHCAFTQVGDCSGFHRVGGVSTRRRARPLRLVQALLRPCAD